MMRAVVVLVALAVGAALGWFARGSLGPEPAGGTAVAAAPDGAAAAAPGGDAAAPTAEPAPPGAGTQAAGAERRPAETVPTAADSAAALAEDVSPEWKMRTRQMAPFSDCMEKTRNAPPSVRSTLVAACHRLPDAPKQGQ